MLGKWLMLGVYLSEVTQHLRPSGVGRFAFTCLEV